MKQNKRFDNILDECLERLLRGETLEQCLQRYPEHATELEPLLRTASAVKKASNVQPRAEFKTRAGYQFRSALREMESGRGRWFFFWQSRWATAVAVVFVLLLLGSGVVAAAGNSMPDGALYPVKLASEQVRLILTPSALGKAELFARLADRRVEEIVYMAGKGDSEQVELVARRLDDSLAMVVSLVAVDGRGGVVPVPESVRQAPALAPRPASERALAPLPVPASESVGEEPREALVQPQPAAEEAREVPERDREVPEVVSPGADKRAKLREIMIRNARNHPERLRAALNTAPESVKPALLRAIQASEKRYQSVLEAAGMERE